MNPIKILIVILTVFSLSLQAKDIILTETSNQFVITSRSLSEFTFVNHLSEVSMINVTKDANEFVKLIVNGYGEDAKSGDAELPVLEELINIPIGSEVDIQILNIEEKIISLSDYGIDQLVFPSQPSISKSENAETAPFYFNEDYYSKDIFYTRDLITTEYLGKMRGQQLGRISIAPFQYNPIKNQLKVVTKMEVKVVFENTDIKEHLSNKKKYYSPEFNHLFKSCVNYIPMQAMDVITTYPVKYVIVADPDFESALQPLVEWKTKKGFIVVEAYTNDPAVGSTTSSIHTYLKDMYDNATTADPAPTYLLIVGDDSQVPSFDNGNHLADMYYCEFDGGGDFYPEMYYGRFSATIAEEVAVQVDKTLAYEQYTFPNPNFLDKVVLVAGVDASMATTYGNGQINYGTDNYFNAAHGLTIYNYLYGSGTPITSDMPAASAAIISDISNGVGFANYTAHCGSSGWSDPSFSTANVPGLNNDNEFGLLIGNCCQSNKFDEPTCFGEALLRANNKGAVGYIGGSNNTYWNEDYWWAVGSLSNITADPTYSGTGLGVYDCLMHENGEQQEDWFITQGQILHSGNLAVTQAGGSEQYYWEIYHLMGDPSLMPYIGVPTLLNVSYQSAIPVATNTLMVTTEENAYVAISMNGVLLDAKLADATGIVNLTFPAVSNVGVADIVVTKQFKEPYIGTVQVIAPTGPYVIYSSSNINDPTGNNNFLADYNELIDMTVDLHNVGSFNANNVSVLISTTDPYVTLTNTSVNVPLINASQIITTPTPFSFQVASPVPDQHTVVFDLTMTDNSGNSWSSNVNVVLNAPVLEHTTFTIDDAALGNGDGRIDAGETFDLVVDVINTGHADIINLIATLAISSPYITVNTANNNVPSLLVNGQYSTIFNVTASTVVPLGNYADFNFNITDGDYSYSTNFIELIGDLAEDYETGDFTQFTWTIDPDFPWTVDNTQVYEGLNSSRSYSGLPDGEESELSIIVDVAAVGDISFWKFVSSEQNEDELKFKINGTKVGEWSGQDAAWSYVSYPCDTIGQNTFKWEYDKNSSNSVGMDCAWIDYIIFPPLAIAQTNTTQIEGLDFKIFPNPTMGSFNLSFNDSKLHVVEIYDNSGKLISRMDKQENISSFDIKNYASGTYTINIMPEGVTYQIVKQ